MKQAKITKLYTSKGEAYYLLECNYCKHIAKVYHLYWCAAECQKCHKMVQNPKHDCAGKSECYYEGSE